MARVFCAYCEPRKGPKLGLARDVDLLAGALRSLGFGTLVRVPVDHGLDWRLSPKRADVVLDVDAPGPDDLVVFHERVYPLRALLRSPACKLFLPNHEFLGYQDVSLAQTLLDGVLHKTAESARVFGAVFRTIVHAPRLPQATTGFTADDRYDPSQRKDFRRFLHVAGTSPFKNTRVVFDAWQRHPEWPRLTIVSQRFRPGATPGPNIDLVAARPSDREIARLMNECGVFILPSAVEGFGLALREAASCGAVIITTDAPPMREHCPADHPFLIEPRESIPMRDAAMSYFTGGEFVSWQDGQGYSQWHVVSPQAVERAVEKLLALPDPALQALSVASRRHYLACDRRFRAALGKAIGALVPGWTQRHEATGSS